MGQVAMKNLEVSMEAICELNEEKIAEVYKREEYIDFMNRKITDYLVQANELVLPLADEKLLGGLFHRRPCGEYCRFRERQDRARYRV